MVADAAERFLNALAGVTDPETKRKIIGREFIRVFEEAARGIVESSDGEPVDFWCRARCIQMSSNPVVVVVPQISKATTMLAGYPMI